ncbi:Acetyl-CoA:oxalate CoA-transferase [Achromobacter animicus]|uniref:Acetyl-CoA:oxalate CoA-transferase n=1 Tax=Achromobacter animicus TaxID=1389935 RepID=A0A6S6ZH90_9BURK|nr:CaiB/BaiF CoA-transferase family protein [Achromobacter animicus]CAB3678824.1 Acetyl-CoA:oxalate CoA-transferase [Achromobacter animicus]
MTSALEGVKVLDLSRVFSGPWAAQMLADFGAEVIKVERPGRGDDVRHQGYPMPDRDGKPSRETSSFVAMNRGKKSVTLDISRPEGQALVRQLAQKADIVIENFKAGDLKRYGLDYASLSALNPRLVYCSITGFGQTGPYSHLPGYDPIFQSTSGLMSVTGVPDGEPGAGPVKAGYSVSDLTAGFYAVSAILAALRHRDQISGVGQHIDLALLDAQIAAISHIGMNYLASGQLPARMGSASQITAPFRAFESRDGHLMVAVGNDSQFRSFCLVIGLPALADDPRFDTNPKRAAAQADLSRLIEPAMRARTVADWNQALAAANVPCGPIYTMDQVFEDPQVRHRQVLGSVEHPALGSMPIVRNPIHFSATPIAAGLPPPMLGEHTADILRAELGLSAEAIERLHAEGIV